MGTKRTDLAMEAREIWQESAEKTTRLQGVKARNSRREGYGVTRVEILDEKGEQALGKPVGTYVTVDLESFWSRKAGFFERAVRAVGEELKAMLPPEGSVLVVGLGNAAMTPDAVGPQTLDSILVTRHLLRSMPRQFSGFRSVSVLRTGVLGTTGLESAEMVCGAAERIKPDFVVAVDALASRRLKRVCATIQLSDTGIVPGSGVGNSRTELSKKTLGVPVFAIGIPTVVDAATLAEDLVEEAGGDAAALPALGKKGAPLMVTPQEVDSRVRELSKVAGYALNWALQDLEIEDVNSLLS
ncbi:GPR endopeptidase [Oscillibacter sp. MSJ-2]|uniref:Germination protease n=1 Tax=Dysosmobacter acutus TaxID=2841504 RepID=A0ABS6F6Q1_9FIRM|nr:GPR endopeptidase [Dysosmobacter acutus]MBU5625738.1 GPR endopeptidase [Dysosmobacter acutus]